jgi:hypothetical protein
MLNHAYTVELRFYGDALEPVEVTRYLDLLPSNSSVGKGGTAKRAVRPFWAYNGHGKVGFQSEWASLEQGLEFLLQQLRPLHGKIVDLSKRFDGIWWCGHFQASFDGGPTLSAKVLAEVASYGLPLFVDNYFSTESQ